MFHAVAQALSAQPDEKNRTHMDARAKCLNMRGSPIL